MFQIDGQLPRSSLSLVYCLLYQEIGTYLFEIVMVLDTLTSIELWRSIFENLILRLLS